jgi:hypothetical protein
MAIVLKHWPLCVDAGIQQALLQLRYFRSKAFKLEKKKEEKEKELRKVKEEQKAAEEALPIDNEITERSAREIEEKERQLGLIQVRMNNMPQATSCQQLTCS